MKVCILEIFSTSDFRLCEEYNYCRVIIIIDEFYNIRKVVYKYHEEKWAKNRTLRDMHINYNLLSTRSIMHAIAHKNQSQARPEADDSAACDRGNNYDFHIDALLPVQQCGFIRPSVN